MQSSFSDHADISDNHNALKLNLYSDDSNSDESDYEDNIPLKVIQEGLNAISREFTICRRTRNTNHHDVTIRYDWMKLNKKFIQCAMWDRLETILKKEMDQLPSLPNCFIGDTAVDRDQVDIIAKKDIPSDILQRFNANCFLLVFAVSGPFTSRLAVRICFSWFSRSEVCAFVWGIFVRGLRVETFVRVLRSSRCRL